MKSAQLFIRSLENEGIKHIFTVPGEEILDLIEAIRRSDIELVVVRHEQAAGFMAATYGRLTGKAGVCLTTLGPGATNLVTAAAYAQLGAMPMLMITGQKPIREHKQGKFQVVDVVEMMRPLTKMTKTIVDGRNIPALVRESFRLAEEERPGTVHLELPEDVARERCGSPTFEINIPLRTRPNPTAINKAAKMIEEAKYPLILIGAGANRKTISKSLLKFLKKTQLYFFNTQMGKGVVDERSDYYLGTAALSEHDYIHCAVNRSDLIINVGHDIVEKPPFFMSHEGAKVIHVNFYAAQIDDTYFPDLNIVGDIAASLESLTKTIKPHKKWKLSFYKRLKKNVELF